MKPQKAALVGFAIAIGVGALFVGLFGYPLYHWYLTGTIEVVSMRSGLTFGYVTYREAPVMFAFQFGRGIVFFALGVLIIAGSTFSLIYHWKRLFQTS
jgi:hypothetical protein